MKSFKVDSISFYSNNTKSYNFRQSLKRKINWNRARKDSLGIYYVPITLSIPRGDKKEVFSNGSRSFPHKVLLVIDPQASEMKYSMWSFLPDSTSSKEKKFTGTLLTEDYFIGQVNYTLYEQNIALTKDKVLQKLSALNQTQAGFGIECHTRLAYTICVEQGDDSYCSDRYETTCSWVDNRDINEEAYDDDYGEGSTGGGGGDGPADDYVLRDSLILGFCDGLSFEQKQALEQSLDLMRTSSCATAYIYSVLKAANLKFGFCIDSTINTGRYSPSTKTLSYQSTFLTELVHLVGHEFIHAYQDYIYPNGTHQYGKGLDNNGQPNSIGDPGFVEIEFEQVVLNAIFFNTNPFRLWDGTIDQEDQFDRWIVKFTNSRTEYPEFYPNGTPNQVAEYASFISEYNNFLQQWKDLPYNPYKSPPLALTPLALIDLLKNTNPICP